MASKVREDEALNQPGDRSFDSADYNGSKKRAKTDNSGQMAGNQQHREEESIEGIEVMEVENEEENEEGNNQEELIRT